MYQIGSSPNAGLVSMLYCIYAFECDHYTFSQLLRTSRRLWRLAYPLGGAGFAACCGKARTTKNPLRTAAGSEESRREQSLNGHLEASLIVR